MTYSLKARNGRNAAVYDDTVYAGLVRYDRGKFYATAAGADWRDDEPAFDNQPDAVEWILAEFRKPKVADPESGEAEAA